MVHSKTTLSQLLPLVTIVAVMVIAPVVLAENRGIALPDAVEQPATEAKLALIIGNTGYSHRPLRNAGNDADDMNQLLTELGFETMLLLDAGQREMEESIREFGERLKNGSVGLFYYAGHAVQVDGHNYLVPIGNRIGSRSDVKYKAVDLGQVMDALESANNRLNILVLDACRDNPFRGYTRGAGSEGLASADAPRGTIIAYATSPGSVSADGDGRNGIYTSALLDQLRVPGLPVEQVFKRARIQVVKATEGEQTPWDSSSLTGEFSFSPKSKEPIQVAALIPSTDYDTSDLEERAKAMERERSAWQDRQEDMDAAFEEAKAYERRNIPYEMRSTSWQRFREAFAQNNPLSERDDQMRTQARERVQYWKTRKDDSAAPVDIASVGDLDAVGYQESPETAARSALDEYRNAYQARDLTRLSKVYIMNPEQQQAMEKLFGRCSEISVRIEERNIEAQGAGIVSVDIDQELDFSGPQCMVENRKGAKMTATVMRRGSGGWVISSILPSRE